MNELDERTEWVATHIVDAAVAVHRNTGPGILESAYLHCMLVELRERKLNTRCDVHLPMTYRGSKLRLAFRVDLVVEDVVIVELKAVPKLLYSHEAQLLTYLRISGFKVGFLLNFHAALMKDGIKRMVNSR